MSATSTGNPVTIYTDGACKGNPGPGGWGAVLTSNGKTLELSGGEFYTTNNVMELTAAIKALEALTKPRPVRLITDSKYIVEGMTVYLEDWKAKGWCKSRGKPVANAELWMRLDELATLFCIEWVRGHGEEAASDRAKQLANRGVGQSCQ